MKGKVNWDKVGMTTSLVCAVHCLALPLLLTSLPILGIDLVHGEAFEIAMIAIAFAVGVVALSKGRKVHRSLLPMVLFVIGIVCLVLKEVFQEWHNTLLIPAVLFILSAHYVNYRAEKGFSGKKIHQGVKRKKVSGHSCE
ncbi:MAG: MerC domain-containing protein [Chitinophagaceae bacterium]